MIQLTSLWSGLTVLIFLVAIGVAVVLARNLTDPLRALGEAALKVGGGDFETRVEMDRSDEFGQLATAFNKMVAEIRDYAQSNRARTDELQALVNHSETLLSSLDKFETLNSALDEVLSATKAEAGAVVLLTDEGDQMLVEAAKGLSAAVVGMRLPFDQFTAPGTAMINRQPIATLDVDEEHRFRAAPFALDRAVKSNLVVPMLLENRVLGALLLDTFSRYEFTVHEINVAQAIANQTAVALERIKLIQDISNSYDQTLAALASALDARDKETEGHSKRVVAYTLALARRMDVPAEILQDVSRGALLHDIGKIGVPDSILHKPGPLNEEEWAIIKKHPEWGKQILEGIPFLGIPAEMVLSHHERWDGTGYPHSKAEVAISIGARIFAVADAFDAITSDRPYRKAATYREAREELIRGKGTQFDPEVVDCFLDFAEGDWAQLRKEAQTSQAGETGALVQGINELRRTITGQLGSLNVIIAAITSSLDLGEVSPILWKP